jgi:quercetin dioxygenase-like cupin family protein
VRSVSEPGALISPFDGHQIVSGLVRLGTGGEAGEHETGGGEKLMVFLEGTAELSFGGKKEVVHSPAVALTPAHTLPNVRNTSDRPLRYMLAYVTAMDGP